MSFSRQDKTLTNAGRANQKARTRAALLQAATELVREGRQPSMQEAAARALISVPTAYRYFTSAEDLWFEASTSAISDHAMSVADSSITASDDPQARLETFIRTLGFDMIDDQVPYRRLAKAGLEEWFKQPDAKSNPVRPSRRVRYIDLIVEPLRQQLAKADADRVGRALGVVVGIDAMLALIDGMRLEKADAKAALLDASRWLLAGALAELGSAPSPASPRPPARKRPR